MTEGFTITMCWRTPSSWQRDSPVTMLKSIILLIEGFTMCMLKSIFLLSEGFTMTLCWKAPSSLIEGYTKNFTSSHWGITAKHCCPLPFIFFNKKELHAAAFSYLHCCVKTHFFALLCFSFLPSRCCLFLCIAVHTHNHRLCHPWIFICCCVASAICTVAAFCFIILLCAHTLTLYSPLLAHREKSSSRCFALHSPHNKTTKKN